MKGLLTKDFSLMMQRKSYFMLILALGIMMNFTMENGLFITGWMIAIMSLFSISTMSYDEYDNGLPFLMTLPIYRRTYALEKYLFSFICGSGAWVVSMLLIIIRAIVNGNNINILEELMGTVVIVPIALIYLSTCLPFNFKFGVEKGRMILFIECGVIGLIPLLVSKIFPDYIKLKAVFDSLGMAGLGIMLLILCIIIAAASVVVSCKIMDNKEY